MSFLLAIYLDFSRFFVQFPHLASVRRASQKQGSMAWLSEAVRGRFLSATAAAAGCISRAEQGCQRVRVRSCAAVAGATARLMINTLIVCHVHRHLNSFLLVAIEQE